MPFEKVETQQVDFSALERAVMARFVFVTPPRQSFPRRQRWRQRIDESARTWKTPRNLVQRDESLWALLERPRRDNATEFRRLSAKSRGARQRIAPPPGENTSAERCPASNESYSSSSAPSLALLTICCWTLAGTVS